MAATVTKMNQAEREKETALPHNIDAEQAVIGALMLDNLAFAKVAMLLEPEDFYERIHQEIYDVIAAMIGAGKLATPISMKDAVSEIIMGDEQKMTGQQYLSHLAAEASSPRMIVDYAKLVKDLADQRRLYFACDAMKKRILACAPTDTAGAMFDEIETTVSDIRPRTSGNAQQFKSFQHFASVAVEMASAAYNNGGIISGLSTGLHKLDDILGGMNRGDLIVIAGRPAMGKEQSVDSIVFTPQGPRRIGDIAVGDQVLGGDGRPVTVLGVYPQGVKESFRLWFSDGASTECGNEHLWAAKNEQDRKKRRDWQVLPLKEIVDFGLVTKKISDRPNGKRSFKWSIPLCGEAHFDLPSENNLVPPYMLGALLGDGALQNGVVLSNPDMDSDISGRIRPMVEAMGFRFSKDACGACPRYRVATSIGGRNWLCEWVRSQCLNVKSTDKFIPQSYLLASIEDRRQLLYGLMDTDGSITENRVSFSTKSRRLAQDLQFLIRSLGGMSKIRVYDRSHHEKGIDYNVTAMLPFCPFLTARKAARWSMPTQAKFKRSIERVEPQGMKEQVCIQVSASDGLYLTDDFVVTHNTALATNIAYNVARDLVERRLDKQRTGVVGFFSLEMPGNQLAGRLIAEHSKISGWRLRKGKVSEREISAYIESGRVLSNLPIEIDATGGLKIGALALRARALKKRLGLEMLIVDYLQLLSGSASGKGREINRVQEITEITSALKALAKELEIPVVALSQLSRKVEERDDKRPILSDLKESSSIEQDSDSVLFVYRDEYYLSKREPRLGTEAHNEWKLMMDAAYGRAEVIIGKNRHGPEGTVHLGYNADITQFNNDVPEKVLGEPKDRGKREKKAPLRLSREATLAIGHLRTLILTDSIENEGHVKAAKGTKLVLYTKWKAKCGEELLDADRDEKKAAAALITLMEKITRELMAPDGGHPALIGRGGTATAPYVWLQSEK